MLYYRCDLRLPAAEQHRKQPKILFIWATDSGLDAAQASNTAD